MTSHFIQQAIEDLGRTFEEFKKTNNERLQSLENNTQNGLLEEKLDRINQALDEAQQKVEKMDLISKRPSLSSAQLFDGHRQAFMEYLLHGKETHLKSLEKKSLNDQTPEEGGYFLPKPLVELILEDVKEVSILRKVARVNTTSFSSYEILTADQASEVTWGVKKEDSKTPTIKKITIPIHSLFSKPRLSSTLLADSHANVERWLVDIISTQMAKVEAEAFVLGDGDGKPQGFLDYAQKSDQVLKISTKHKGGFSKKEPENTLIDAIYSLKPEYLHKATWILSRNTLSEIRKMRTPDGHYIWQPSLSRDLKQHSLLGFPVLLSEHMPKLKDGEESLPIAFGDWSSAYQIVERQGFSILRDQYTHKPDVELMITQRLGGNVLKDSAFLVISAA